MREARPRATRERLRSRVAVALLSAALATGAATAARAQDPVDPPPTPADDTELTPQAKENTQWTLIGGAKYRGGGKPVVDGSPTDHRVDFVTTSLSPTFIDSTGNPEGLFGGAECIDEDVPFDDEALRNCRRRPAIYRFWIDATGEHIAKVPSDELLDSPDEEGFVGAIAWIDGGRALAVGGTGTYPRREPSAATPRPGETPDEAYLRKDREGEQGSDDKPAGHARAWIYEDQDGDGEKSWRELTDEELKEDANADGELERMGAMTALECRRQDFAGNKTNPKGTCVAGGMQRLWWWRPKSVTNPAEGFDRNPVTGLEVPGASTTTAGIDVPSNPLNPSNEPDFHFRVRQIRYAGTGDAAAVTAGCCAERLQLRSGANGTPEGTATALGGRLLQYDPGTGTDTGRWRAKPFSQLLGEDLGAATGRFPDSLYAITNARGSLGINGTIEHYEGYGLNGVASPGGKPAIAGEEPGARIVSSGATGGESNSPQPALDSVRLLAAGSGDDWAGTKDALNGSSTTDVLLDWAVGSLKQGSVEGTAEGVAYTTLEALAYVPQAVVCESGTSNCEVVRENIANASFRSRRLISMGTYSLNALAFIFKTDNGWAAGDRGAIARLGGGGKLGATTEPAAPRLRPRTKPIAERGPFEQKRPESHEPDAVPAMASRPVEKLERPVMVPYGSADASRRGHHPLDRGGLREEAIASIAMSRDGSEGWAVGSGAVGHPEGVDSSGSTFTLQHFDGERWVRCNIDGLGGALEPDPACASLASLPRERESFPLRLYRVARIPLERDGDPSNDDEFAATALGWRGFGGGTSSTTVLIYRNGSWRIDKDASETIKTSADWLADVAFRAPDDGWLVTNNGALSGEAHLYHYGGGAWPAGRWVDCALPQYEQECGATNGDLLEGGRFVSNARVQVAGDAVFIAGTRSEAGSQNGMRPVVFAKKPGERWQTEYDPGCGSCGGTGAAGIAIDPQSPLASQDGRVDQLSVVDLGNDEIAGWLSGTFGSGIAGDSHGLMRRDPEKPVGSSDAWSFREVSDAAKDFLPTTAMYDHPAGNNPPGQLLSFKGEDGGEQSFLSAAGGRYMLNHHAPLEYSADKDRWQVAPAPFLTSMNCCVGLPTSMVGEVTAATPDNRGGVWVAVRGNHSQAWTDIGEYRDLTTFQRTYFYHYTTERPKAVFQDSPSPVRERITDLDGTADGTVWVSTESDRLYRYDRLGGWERVSIPEWDSGRVVTRRSKAFALAVNDSGEGIVVGERGRIAGISSDSVTLDAASVNRCSEAPPPCGTPRDLRAATVAPDGSAMAGGDNLTVTWRPARGQFRLIDSPRTNASAKVTDLSMPDSSHAWLTLDNGEIWAADLIDPTGTRPWRWRRESSSEAARDESPTDGALGRLFGIEVDREGRGLAVGARGAMLERQRDGTWKRLNTGFLDNLQSVELPPQGYGDGTLVGGWLGVILTRSDGRFHLARPADRFDPLTSNSVEYDMARIVGLAISGGPNAGETEAWAASQVDWDGTIGYDSDRHSPQALLHYASSENPLLNPERRAETLADSPPEGEGEVTLAAFGRSECQIHRRPSGVEQCTPFAGNNLFNQRLAERVREEIVDRGRQSVGPVVAASTGDLSDAPGREIKGDAPSPTYVHPPTDPAITHHRWRDFIADPLLEHGIAMVGTPGERDLSRPRSTDNGLFGGENDPRESGVGAGNPIQWRETFASMPAPWGTAAPFSVKEYDYRPVPGSPTAVEYPDQKVEDPTKPVPDQTVEDPTKGTEDPTITPPPPGAEQTVELPRPGDQEGPPRTGDQTVKTSGAHTHYAVDVVRKSDGKAISRLVVADTSNLRSLAASDPNQNPAEPQQAWLEEVLCIKGSPTDAGRCTRAQGTPAVVVTTTPPYSYGAGAVEQTQQEAASFEALMLRHKVTALVTGHMGWNGLYYTFAPSLHFPQPGGEHPDSTRPPTGPGDARGPDPSQLPVDPGDLSGDNAVTGVLPTVIASSAGGLFGPRGEDSGTASQGYWHGYSIVRVPGDGDPRKVIVEQRPILDWINISAKSRVLRPQQRLKLEGIGREPFGTDTEIRLNEIDSHAITHCYDLLLADPDKPWLPLEAEDASEEQLASQGEGCPNRQPASSQVQAEASEDEGSGAAGPCAPYVCLPAQIGTINHQTGDVKAGGGEQERTFGIAVLTVGEQTATWPIAFEPRPSFSPPRVPPPPPPPPPVPPTPPPPPPVGTVGNLNLPTPPALPSLPLGAELMPPAPPIPPPPPGAANVAPLNLFLSVPGINIAPQSTVVPPPAPPIQPAPPGGARKEARQRQAAAQKSGADGAQSEVQELGGDTANGPPSPDMSAATRHDLSYAAGERARPTPSITPLTHHHQPSAWARNLQWGGGMTLMALVLAFGWITVRPTPRRRQPELPAPAYARYQRRRH